MLFLVFHRFSGFFHRLTGTLNAKAFSVSGQIVLSLTSFQLWLRLIWPYRNGSRLHNIRYLPKGLSDRQGLAGGTDDDGRRVGALRKGCCDTPSYAHIILISFSLYR